MAENASWHLEDFVDSLVVELDKTRETLAVKAVNKPLTYTVKDVALDLNIFPSYDGDQVKFITAQPGQQGASKVTIQLSSITDQQVRATTKTPSAKDDIKLDEIELPPKARKKLRRLGVSSVSDLQQIENKNIDLHQVSDEAIDYQKLANQIQKARRSRKPPKVEAVTLSLEEDRPCLVIRGHNLSVDPAFRPVAVVNQVLAEVASRSDRELRIELGAAHRLAGENDVIVTFDPFAVMKMRVKV